MILHRSISKEQMKQLPEAKFSVAIEVVQTKADAVSALKQLNEQPLLGIDSETRPAFVKGISHKVALLQISSESTCFLFRLNSLGLMPELVELLENPRIKKIGLSLRDDFLMLRKRAPFKQASCIDLQEFIKPFGIKDKSLQKLYAILFGERISKAQRLSNWEAPELSEAQKRYAAMDAWSCLRIYKLLEELKAKGNYTLAPEVQTELNTNK